MSGLCVNNHPKYLQREKDLHRMYNYWNQFDAITKSIGKASDSLAKESMDIMAENLFDGGKPLSIDVDFSPGELKRMEVAIKDLDKRIRKNTVGSFMLNFSVGESLSMKHPLARSFYEEVSNAANFERNYTDKTFYDIKSISESLLEAIALTGDKDFRKNLRLAQNKYFKTSAGENSNAQELAMRDLKYEIDSLIKGPRGGKVFRDYNELVSMDNNTFKKGSKDPKIDKRVRNAAEQTRSLLNTLGEKVVLPGLDNLYEAAVRKAHNGEMPKLPDKSLIAFKKKIEAAQDRVKQAIKKGGYFPHIMLENLIEINASMNNNLLSSKGGLIDSRPHIAELGEQLDTFIPNRLKAKTPLGEHQWNADPIEVLNNYARDVIAFNKINHIAANYLKVAPKFHENTIDSKFIDGMRVFLDDTFQVATRGFKDRPDWVNDLSRTLLSVYTMKTMGFSTTGAMRNLLSATYFFGGAGIPASFRAMAAYKGRKKYGGDPEGIDEILRRVETEQGFEFVESQTVNDMIADGLITRTADRTSIEYDPHANQIRYKDGGYWRTIDDAVRNMTGKTLVFHRWGENLTRKMLFRTAFIQSYEVLSKTDLTKPMRVKKAQNFALRTVNQFAFEYAPHAKARMVGGRAASGPVDPVTGKRAMTTMDKMAAVGPIMFQFMHFPMSFLQNQARIIKGGVDGVRAGQIDAPEYQQILSFAGIWGATQALSIALNVDLNNIMENDTIERIKEIAEHITSDPDVEGKKRGLTSQFTGPVPSDIMFWLNVNALNNSDPSEFSEMLFGDIDYDDPVNIQNAKRYSLSTEWGRWTNKIWPEISNGHGWQSLFRHIMAAYPRDWTKEMNKKVMSWQGLPEGMRRKPTHFKRKSTTRDKQLLKLNQLSADLRKGMK